MEELFSVRMRAAVGGAHESGGRHVSGAERMVGQDQLQTTVLQMVNRAMQHEKAIPDFVNLTIEKTGWQAIAHLEALPISTVPVNSVEEGHAAALQILTELGISPQAAELAIRLLAGGAAPGGQVMRGAVIMDAQTGQRLEPDLRRGVRVSRIDWAEETLQCWRAQVSPYGFDRERVWEALSLATKVVHASSIAAELCWSDDPSYVTGYVAARPRGYIRIPHLKHTGDPLGGRVFFVRQEEGFRLDELIGFLEETPALVSRLPISLVHPYPEARFSR